MNIYMNKQSISILTLIVSISCFLFSCGHKKGVQMGNLQFDSLQVNETAHLFGDTSKPACNIIINFTYPILSSDELLKDTLNHYFITACFGEKYNNLTPREAVKQYTAKYIKDYKSDVEPYYLQEEKDIKDGGDICNWCSYYKSIESNVQFYDKGLLVYRTHYDEYTGGAHGMYMTTFLNIDLALMRPLTLDDIFVGDYKEEVTTLIWAELMAKHRVKTHEALEDMGYGSIGEIAPTSNFYLNNKGITFYYNVYDITPYAMGPVSVTLSYDSIDHWLNSNPIIEELKK